MFWSNSGALDYMGSFSHKGLELDKSDLKNLWGDIPEGLVPIGDAGIYVSPHVKEDRPVSPLDCENYPDSPFCGGQPFTRTPVGIDLEFQANECGGSITGTPILGFTKLPPISVAWIAEHCRKEYDAKRKTPTPLPPPPDIGDIPPADGVPGGFHPDDIVIAILAGRKYSVGTTLKHIYNEAGQSLGQQKVNYSTYYFTQLLEVEHPTFRTVNYGGFENYSLKGWAKLRLTRIGIYGDESGTDVHDFELHIRNNAPKVQMVNHWMMPPRPATSEGYWLSFDYNTWEVPTSDVWEGGYILVGRYGSIFPGTTLGQSSGSNVYSADVAESYWGKYETLYIALLSGKAKNKPTNPDDYKKRDCCMQCCTGGQAQERQRDQDLAEVLKLLKEIKKAVGFDDLPVKMPASLISKDEGFIGNLIPNAPASEDSIPKLLTRFIRYFDEIMGQWEIPIEIKDADPLTPGDQPKGVKLHNIAECLADMYAMQFDNYLITQQLMHLNSKTLIEQGLTKQNVVQNYYALLCLIDFFGFKYKEIDADVPLSFKAGESRFEDFIKDSEQRIKVFDLDVNDKNVVTYKDDMTVLYQMAQIIKAVHFRKLDHKGDMKQQIVDLVKFASQYVGKVEDGEIDPSGNKKDDFQDWLEDAETEFSRKTGINTQNPYGRPYEQRPRLTILDVDNPTQD